MKTNKVSAVDVLKANLYEYAQYVNMERMTPNLYDNKTAVQRRILYTMYKNKMFHTGHFTKNSTIVGLTLPIHPHGDKSVADALVNLARPFKNNVAYVDGHGAYGDVLGNPAAAMRYISARLSKYSSEFLFKDFAKETVDWRPDYEEETFEPCFLAPILPDLLINGNSGIGIGFQPSIPSHQPLAVAKLCIEYVRNRKMPITQAMQILKAPDFPTGGNVNIKGLRSFYETGSGYINLSGDMHYVKEGTKHYIEITSLPFNRTVETFRSKLAQILKDDTVKSIIGFEDLSSMDGMRVRLRIDSEEAYDSVASIIRKKTCFSYRMGLHMIVTQDGEYRVNVPLLTIVDEFVKFRSRTLYKKYKKRLKDVEARLHNLDAVIIVSSDIEKVIKLVKTSKDRNASCDAIMKAFKLTRMQAEYIVDMRIYKLSSLEIDAVKKEIKELTKERDWLNKITVSEYNKHLDKIMCDEWEDLIVKHPDIFYKKRKTNIL